MERVAWRYRLLHYGPHFKLHCCMPPVGPGWGPRLVNYNVGSSAESAETLMRTMMRLAMMTCLPFASTIQMN